MNEHFDDSDQILGKAYDRRLVGRLLHYVAPHKNLVFLAAFFMAVSTCVDLLIPYLTKIGIDRYLARLYQEYDAPAAVCDSLAALDRTGADFLRIAPDTLLVRKAATEKMAPEARVLLSRRGNLQAETWYLFPARDRTGETGRVRGPYWMVRETDLRAVPVPVLLRIRGADVRGITRLAVIAALVLIVGLLAGYGHVLSLQVSGQRSMYDLRTALFRHIQGLSLSFFDRNPVGRLVTRVTNDIDALNEMFSAVLVNLLKDILLVFGTFGVLFYMNATLALYALIALPVLLGVSFLFRFKVRGAYREVRRFLARLNARLSEDLSGIRVIQVFRREQARRESYREINTEYFRANMNQLVIFGVFRPIVELLGSTGVALILVYGGVAVLHGALTLGALVAFLRYVRQMFNPILDMSDKYNIMQSAMASAERVFGIMDTRPEITERMPEAVRGAAGAPGSGRFVVAGDGPASERLVPLRAEDLVAVPGDGEDIALSADGDEIRGAIEFEHVHFSYVAEKPVLRDVSFRVEPGRSVAIVGPTGAGKTSIISLLCRFYDPNAGSIRLDGRDLRDLPFELLRRNIAMVLQDAFIFSRTVEENIRLGSAISSEGVSRAASLVQAHEFIERLPQGYSEMMAERGATLSTGQKQLLCFARALAHDPKVLILDEATSSVDPATEQLIQNATETLMRGRTSIIVAHRLSTIQKADEILVMDDGRILERGTHQELLARRGIYYNLYLLQYRAA